MKFGELYVIISNQLAQSVLLHCCFSQNWLPWFRGNAMIFQQRLTLLSPAKSKWGRAWKSGCLKILICLFLFIMQVLFLESKLNRLELSCVLVFLMN